MNSRKLSAIGERVDAFAHRQLAARTLPRDAFRSAHLFGELFTSRQLVDFVLPAHCRLPFVACGRCYHPVGARLRGEGGWRKRRSAGREKSFSTAYQWYALGVLFVVYVFNFIDRSVLALLAQSIKEDLQISDTALGLLGGLAFAVFYTGLGIPIARLADKGNRRNILVVCLSIWSAATACADSRRATPTCCWRASVWPLAKPAAVRRRTR